eukprot:CAMPEP_0170538630 /NCGR_PEP_ID=MMETSP0209-20121228/103435_1 /TAXON_ID=665100 ORGANISM="Litonotus pictus, Strain P1" /NCGR_SAMPLE_ID=MMETSP0209 /ASSEMBLY_ACC=CAM_ASM_000301 /LENGTH=280 /DNA_ID=CAMNT_0010840373 /DNA_START=450 /DNA_END=1288 /DNA_ORIENTATION=+
MTTSSSLIKKNQDEKMKLEKEELGEAELLHPDEPHDKKRRFSEVHMDEMKHKDKNDEFGFSTSWKRAYGEVYNMSSWLHGFCAINKIAANKILKKFKKTFISKCAITEGELAEEHLEEVQRNSEELSIVTDTSKFILEIEEMVNFRMHVINCYAEYFCDSNAEKAKNHLEIRLMGGFPKEMKLISFYLGVFITMIFLVIVLIFIPSSNEIERESMSMMNFFPPLNFTLMIALLFLGLGLNLYVFHKYRVNYIYIFEIDPDLRLTPLQIIKFGLFMGIMWL